MEMVKTVKTEIFTQPLNYFFLAIDFDDTLVEDGFPDINKANIKWDIIQKIEDMERDLMNEGFTVVRIMWTCRSNNDQGNYLDDAVNLCKKIKFRIDYVNENPLCPFTHDMTNITSKTPKIFYHVLIDDRAINPIFTYEDIVNRAKNH